VGEYRADWRSDIGWRQGRSRDLVEQRLEEVMIALVDDGHVNRLTG
jgi:hypothetical protein